MTEQVDLEDYLGAVNDTLRELHAQRDILRQLTASKTELVNRLEYLNTAIERALEDERACEEVYEHRLGELRAALNSKGNET